MKDDLGPYSRVYWSVRSDPKFRGVYANDNLLATWLRLLMSADAIWPEPADLPSTCRKVYFNRLVAAGLLDDLGGGQYRVHGLDAERTRRADHAKNASNARWNARSNAGSNAAVSDSPMLAKDEPRVSQEQAEDTPTASASDPVVIYANLTGGWPAPGAVDWLDDLTERFGDIELIKAIGEASKTAKRGQIIGAAKTLLEMQGRELQKTEKKAEHDKITARRLDGMHSRRLEWFRNTGQWDEAWGERPAA